MNKKNQTIDELMDGFFSYARSIQRSEGTIKRYNRRWQKIKDFMSSRKIKFCDDKVAKDYLASQLGNYDYYQLDQRQKVLVNTTESLTEFQETGRIIMGARKRPPKILKVNTVQITKRFISDRGQDLSLSSKSISAYIFHLYPFCCYLNKKGSISVR